MTDFLAMQTLIADQLVRDDLSTQTKQAINDAIKTWEGNRFTFNERKYVINTVAGTEYYNFATPDMELFDGTALATGETLIEIDDIGITINNRPYPLTERTFQWFTRHAVSATIQQGEPDSYTIFNNQIRVFPIPNAVYPINIAGLARLGPNPLVQDTDTNAWMVEGEQLIRHQAKYLLYRDTLRDAEGKAAAVEGVQEAQFQLDRKSTGRIMTGTQRAWNL